MANVFQTLKKLFSSDVVVRRIGKGKFRVIDAYNTQAMGMLATNYLTGKYSSLYLNNFNYGYSSTLTSQSQRFMLFREYEIMDQDPIISSVLDIYSEESTIKNYYGDIVTVKSDDKEIKGILDNLFYDILNIDFNLVHWVRNLVKYGDMFLKLDLAEKIGIVGVIPISSYFIQRLEGIDMQHPYEVSFKIDGPFLNGTYDNYEISHFRMLTDSNFLPYGKSMIEGARRIWKQLTLMEDAMLIHRIIRAPQKRIFKIDVGNLSPEETDLYIRKIADQIKKVPYMDENGNYNLKYNIQNITEDFFIPTRGPEANTVVDTLQGLEYNAIEDVEYLKCLRGDIKIKLLNGEDKSIKEISETFEPNKYETWSINPNTLKLEPVKIIGAKKTIKDAKLIRIVLDNNEYIDCTYNHKFMLRDGTFMEADKLSVGASVMPLYTKITDEHNYLKGYELIYNPGENKWRYSHRIVGEYKYPDLNNHSGILHHVDFNKLNNTSSFTGDKHNFTENLNMRVTNQYSNHVNYLNHKIKDIIYLTETDDTYDIEVSANSNFALSSGIFVHNSKMLAALKVPKAFIGFEEAIGCVVPDTQIPLLSGNTKSVKELIIDYELGITNYVYSIDENTNKIVPGKIEWAGYTRKHAELVRVHLDNNNHIDCTPDHKFMLRNNIWVEAKDLKENDSLMPLYRKHNGLGYETVYDINSCKYIPTHKMVVEGINKYIKGNVTHHVDFNKTNNYPDNLDCTMNFRQHRKYHQDNIKKTLNSKENIERRVNDPNWLNSVKIAGRKGGLKSKDKLVKWIKQNGPWNKGMSRCKKKQAICSNCGLLIEVLEGKKNKNYVCSETCRKEFFRGKNLYNYITLDFDYLIECAKQSTSFKDLCNRSSTGRHIIFREIQQLGLSKLDFINCYMPLAKENRGFLNNYMSELEFIPKYGFDELMQVANNSNSISDACKKLKITLTYFNKMVEYHGYDKIDFVLENMPKMKNNKMAWSQFEKTINKKLNHKVKYIEKLNITEDVCDITIFKYNNFATDAGVIIHNSKATLSQEDIRFARTIERIQKIVAAELNNLALVHLYVQGYREEDLANFELTLSSPSTIYEQEKIELWKSRLDVAQSAKQNAVLGNEFLYKEIFDLTTDRIEKINKSLVEDSKFEYRLNQIKEQGNDPAASGQHADESGTVRQVNEPDQIDVEGNQAANSGDGAQSQGAGRPKESKSNYKTDEHPMGRDPLGQKDMKQSMKVPKPSKLSFKGGSPLSVETKKDLKQSLFSTKILKKILKENGGEDIMTGSMEEILN